MGEGFDSVWGAGRGAPVPYRIRNDMFVYQGGRDEMGGDKRGEWELGVRSLGDRICNVDAPLLLCPVFLSFNGGMSWGPLRGRYVATV